MALLRPARVGAGGGAGGGDCPGRQAALDAGARRGVLQLQGPGAFDPAGITGEVTIEVASDATRKGDHGCGSFSFGGRFDDSYRTEGIALGDLDGDGFVGLNTLDLVRNNWNLNVPPAEPAADRSGDGFVGLDDLDEVLNNWNTGTPPAGSAVPEPATVALLGLGGAALFGRRRK